MGSVALRAHGEQQPVTLLEAFAALVILGLSAVAYLAFFEGSANAAHRADVSSHLVAYAESSLSEAAAGDGRIAGSTGALPAGMSRRVERHAWRTGLEELVVTVRTTDGDSIQLHRLVRAR